MDTSISQCDHTSLDNLVDRPSTPEERARDARKLTALFDQWDTERDAISQPSNDNEVTAEPTGDVISGTAAVNDAADGGEAVSRSGDLTVADEPTELAVPQGQSAWHVAPDDFHAGTPDEAAADEDFRQPDIVGDEADEAPETETLEVGSEGVDRLDAAAPTSPDGGEFEVEDVATSSTDEAGELPPRATTEVMGEANPAASSTEASQAASTAADESADDEEQRTPQFFKRKLVALLDESQGDLVALEDFDGKVDERAFESEWLGAHNDISRQAIRGELLRKGEYTAHVDDKGKLLSDPDEYPLAVENNAMITLCVHRERSEDQKREFILRSQTGKRILNYEEQRALTNRLIVVQLRLGVDYESIAKMARVHPNTVRNVENRAAADSNSKLGNTKRPDGRFNPETRTKIVEASKLRADGKSNAEIAEVLGTNIETVGKWFKEQPARTATKIEDKPDKKPKTSRATSPPQPIKDIAAGDGVPPLHWRALERLGQGTQAYMDRLQARAAETRQEVEAVSDIDEMQDFLLCYSLGLALGELRLRNLLRGGGEIDVEEAVPPSDSSPNKAEHEPDTILLGTVMAIEPHEVFVALSVSGGGVIDNRDNYLDWHWPPKVDEVVRVRVEGFDWSRGLWKLQQVGVQTPAPAPGAIAAEPDRDDRCSPYADLAGRKAGPKEKEVSR